MDGLKNIFTLKKNYNYLKKGINGNNFPQIQTIPNYILNFVINFKKQKSTSCKMDIILNKG